VPPSVVASIASYIKDLASSAHATTRQYASFYGSARLFMTLCDNKMARIDALSCAMRCLNECVQSSAVLKSSIGDGAASSVKMSETARKAFMTMRREQLVRVDSAALYCAPSAPASCCYPWRCCLAWR
jgi:hypothetical protein